MKITVIMKSSMKKDLWIDERQVLPMKTVAEIFKIAGITHAAVFDSDHGSRMFDTGLLCGLWYGHAITYDEYRAASHALDILHWGMIL